MSEFESLFGKPRRGDFRCNFIGADGKRCLFAADYMTTDGYVVPDDPMQCGRHLPENYEIEMEKERAHAAYWASRPPPFPPAVITDTPACWSWQVTDEIREHLRLAEESEESEDLMTWVNHRSTAERLFTQGRCGICGVHIGTSGIEDHCHETGLVRGYLCRSCNTREGMNGGTDNVWGRYRAKHPYSILGIREPYSGRGWEDGRPVGYGPGEWPPPDPDPEDRWKNNAMRDVL